MFDFLPDNNWQEKNTLPENKGKCKYYDSSIILSHPILNDGTIDNTRLTFRAWNTCTGITKFYNIKVYQDELPQIVAKLENLKIDGFNKFSYMHYDLITVAIFKIQNFIKNGGMNLIKN